jgi:cation diffusion facilitator CzcD-associated flavoprotein CzcO
MWSVQHECLSAYLLTCALIDIDIPSHAYQLSFESWIGWSQFYAGALEILDYWRRVADKYGVGEHVMFQHKCVEARWDETQSKWRAKFLRVDLEEPLIVEDEADVLVTGTGLLNEWKWPKIEGLHTFKGDLLHTADWDDKFDSTVSILYRVLNCSFN